MGLRHITTAKTPHDKAVREVSKQVVAKWFHDTVFCIPLNGVVRKLDKMWKTFREGRKRLASGQGGRPVDELKELVEQANKLFDIRADTALQEEKCKAEWGVTMSQAEYTYYDDQKAERQMQCDRGVDPVWYQAVMRRERMREREEKYRQERDKQFQFKDMAEIEAMLSAEGETVSASTTSAEVSPEKVIPQAADCGRKKRKLFVCELEESEMEEMPARLTHVRDSERNVRDSFYLTVGTWWGGGCR